MKTLFRKIYRILIVQLLVFTCISMQARSAHQEAVYLQTDRKTYIAGESVYYKMYVLDVPSKKRSHISKIGYIELRAPKSDPALKIRVQVDAGLANGCFLLPDTLPSGIYQVVAFTSFMRNQGEQSFFQGNLVIVDRFDKKMDFKDLQSGKQDSSANHQADLLPWIRTDKSVYAPREKVVLSLSNNTNQIANVAVSVYEEPGVAATEKSIIETLKGWTVEPLLTDYLPESKAKILRGRVIDAKTRKSVQSATVLLSCPDIVPNLQYATTNMDGLFQMSLDDYYNSKELFLTLKDIPAGTNWKIEVEDNFNLSDKWEPERMSNKVPPDSFLLKSQDIVSINRSFKLEDGILRDTLVKKEPEGPQLYHIPVKSIYTSDFIPLNDFREIALEILPTVIISKRDNTYKARLVSFLGSADADKDPAIFLDGVYIDDINKIMGLGSDRIHKIDVIQTERAFGDLVFYGVISIISKSNEIVKTKPASNSLRIKNDRTNICKNFEAVNPNSIKERHTPFFRQLLYWNPNLELKGNQPTDLEFYTSDNLGNFTIKMEGITENGLPVSSSFSFQVQNTDNTTAK